MMQSDVAFDLDDLESIVQGHQRELLHSGLTALPARLSLTLRGRPVHPSAFARWRRGPFGQDKQRLDPEAFEGLLDEGAVLRVRDVQELHGALVLDDPHGKLSQPRADAVARWRSGTQVDFDVARRTRLLQVTGEQMLHLGGESVHLTPGWSVDLPAGMKGFAVGPVGDEACLHLEVTSTVPTVRDLLAAVRPALIDSEIARNALPPLGGDQRSRAHLAKLGNAIAGLITPGAVEDLLDTRRADTSSGRRPNLPWAATRAVLPASGGRIWFPPRPNGALVDAATLEQWFPAIDRADLELLAGAAAHHVAIDELLAAAGGPVRLRNAIVDLVLGGVLEVCVPSSPC